MVDTSCPSSGKISVGDTCTVLTNGTLYDHNGGGNLGTYVWITYGKSGGSTLSLKLGYEHSGTNTGRGRRCRRETSTPRTGTRRRAAPRSG
ncbi:hypothetical protein ACFQZC_00830 [Streptacidiphilus monticola]